MKLAAHMSILTGLPSIAKRGIVDPFENPNRATTLIASLERSWPMVHHCVAFLEEAYARFMELRNPGPEVLPNVHPYRGASASFAGRGKPPDPGRST